MKIGISTGFSDRLKINVYEALDIVASTPFRTIELWTLFYGKYKHFAWDDIVEVKYLKKKLDDYKIQVNSIHAPFSYQHELATNDKTYLATVVKDTKDIILVATELGANFVVIHPASRPDTSRRHISSEEYKQRFELVKKSLQDIADFVNKHNLTIKIALENQLPHIMFGYFDELLELITGLDNKIFGICFDTSHAMMTYGNNTDTVLKNIEYISKFIITTHISDTDGTTDAHLLPGEGKIEWHKLANGCLQKLSNDAPLILEVLTPLKDKTLPETLNEAYRRMVLLTKEWW